MYAKLVEVSVLSLTVAAHCLTAAETETIAYFPLDADPYSIVNPDRNPSSASEYWDQSPHSVTYASDVSGATVCDRSDNFVRSNAGCVKLEKTRLAINLNAFPLSNDVNTVTIEMFVKGMVPTAYFPFFCLGNFAAGMSVSSSPEKPYLLLNPYGADGYVYAYACPDATYATQQIFAEPKVFDDRWHHVVLTIEPEATGRSLASLYLDGTFVKSKVIGSDWDVPVKWTGGAGLEGHGPLYLYLGTRRSTVYLDELRITKGLLPSARWLRQHSAPVPADGETLLYLPFDTDGRTIVHAEEDSAASISTGLVFADNIGSRKALRDGEKTFVRAPNRASLFCDRTRYYYTPSYWAFRSNSCESATIEFFYKGDADPAKVADSSPMFRIGNDANSLRLVLSSYSSVQQGVDHRAFLAVRDRTNGKDTNHATSVVCGKNGDMCDGRWHHVALTTETTENGTKGLVKLYWDYELVKTATLAEPWCAVDPALNGDVFNLGSSSCVCSIDELRISKGALPPEKFLRKFSTDGMMLIVR